MATVINFLKNLGLVKLLAIISAILTFIILIAVYFYTISSSPNTILYSDLASEDSAEIIEQLELNNVKYELVAGGTIIKVNKDLVPKLRISMAKKGLPKKGSLIGYEIFDKDENLGTTSFAQNVKMIRALEGELSRTIETFNQVKKARVHLVLPHKEIFSRNKQVATASIMLKISRNSSLKKSEIAAISYLVSTAVPQLNPRDITIVDSQGNSLQLGGTKEDSDNYYSDSNAEFKLVYENKLKKNVEDLLEKLVGSGKVKTSINVDMNFDRIIINSELYDPDSSAIRSAQSSEEQEFTPQKNEDNTDMSVANNLPDNFSNHQDLNRFATVNKNDETTNYEVSKTIKNQINQVGVVNKLSISVLIDGHYALNEDKKSIYSPRSDEEMIQIEKLVKTAVGFDEERGDKINVVNIEFIDNLYDFQTENDIINWIQEYLPQIIQMLLLAVTVILIFIYVIKPIVLQVFSNKDITNKASDTEQTKKEITDEKDKDDTKNENIVSKSSDKLTDLKTTIENNPEDALSILRQWLRE